MGFGKTIVGRKYTIVIDEEQRQMLQDGMVLLIDQHTEDCGPEDPNATGRMDKLTTLNGCLIDIQNQSDEDNKDVNDFTA